MNHGEMYDTTSLLPESHSKYRKYHVKTLFCQWALLTFTLFTPTAVRFYICIYILVTIVI